MSTSPFLTEKQVAERWGVSPDTVKRIRTLPVVLVGKRSKRYRPEDVASYEEKNIRKGSQAEPGPELITVTY